MPELNPEQEKRFKFVESELEHLRHAMGDIASFEVFTRTNFFVFPGGLEPTRQTSGAIGFDAYARAIVDPLSKPIGDDPLRRSLGDFNKIGPDWKDQVDPTIQDWVVDDESDPTKYSVDLPEGERLMVGLGIATEMEFPLFYWVAPRSGYASRGITVANSPGTVDPDYRGEAGALIENNSNEPFNVSHQQRIVQLLFGIAMIPELHKVTSHRDLSSSDRGAGGFGSTGKH
ncbi:MAG: deoxyuridine 5-triphosphate nucleotidohydrolase [Candidatus Saccharibacteria bacterium]|nr:deoxyuridine 5-triphosphate nucleotidohydrolase [Candidatus Saccharibacteria bacterium]